MRESIVPLRTCIDLNVWPISFTATSPARSFIELTRALPGSRPPVASATFGAMDDILWSLTERWPSRKEGRGSGTAAES